MISIEKLRHMIEMQARMNSAVDPNWVQARYPYLRAVVAEGAEAMDHWGWKWWKGKGAAPNLVQFQIELVDIWHFALSHFILVETKNAGLPDLDEATDAVFDQIAFGDAAFYLFANEFEGRSLSDLHMIEMLELMIGNAITKIFSVSLFAAIMERADLSWDQLYRMYIGKNVLNLFRQANGYKRVGHYEKIWAGREDNEHLEDVLAMAGASFVGDLESLVYEGLTTRYRQLVLDKEMTVRVTGSSIDRVAEAIGEADRTDTMVHGNDVEAFVTGNGTVLTLVRSLGFAAEIVEKLAA